MIFENQLDVDLNKSMGLVFGVTSKIDSWFNKNSDEGVLYTGGYWNTNAFADNDKKIIAVIYKQTQFTNENSWGKLRDIIYQ